MSLIHLKRLIPCMLLLGSLLPMSSFADQKYTLTVAFDKKIICADSIQLPKSSRAIDVLRMLPELLERPSTSLTSNYDIKIEDVTLGDASDAVLNQLTLSAIDKIEISESPISSFQHNGQGGSINIFLKRGRNDGKVSGSAAVDYEYETDVLPFAQVNYGKNKFSLTGLLFGEYYNPSIPTYNSTKEGSVTQTKEEDWRSQMARLNLRYDFTNKDVLRVALSESTSRVRNDITYSDFTGIYVNDNDFRNNFDKANNTTLRVFAGYKHTYNPYAELVIEENYAYMPEGDINNRQKDIVTSDPIIQDKDVKAHNLSSKVEYKVNLFPLSSSTQLALLLGMQNNVTWYNSDMDYSYEATGLHRGSFNTNDKSFHLMPYINLELYLGKFKCKGVVEYQYFRYSTERSDYYVGNSSLPNHVRNRNDVTGMLMLCYQFTPHKHLRLTLNRKLNRPSMDQIYPYLDFNESANAFELGNPALSPMLSNEIGLDYIADYHWGDHRMTLNAGVTYNYISDEIRNNAAMGTFEGVGKVAYITYTNDGRNHMVNGNLMLWYSWKWFSCSFVGNVFNNCVHWDVYNDHNTYYNLSLTPALNFDNGWMASLGMTYYSKQTTSDTTTDGCLMSQLRIGKNVGKWNFHIFGKASLTGKVDKVTTVSNISETESLWLVRNCIGAGVMLKF